MSTFHVATTGTDTAPGTASAPFRTINHAAALALPGDTVIGHDGTYREWVTPRHGGLSDTRRITYPAPPSEHPVLNASQHTPTPTRKRHHLEPPRECSR